MFRRIDENFYVRYKNILNEEEIRRKSAYEQGKMSIDVKDQITNFVGLGRLQQNLINEVCNELADSGIKKFLNSYLRNVGLTFKDPQFQELIDRLTTLKQTTLVEIPTQDKEDLEGFQKLSYAGTILDLCGNINASTNQERTSTGNIVVPGEYLHKILNTAVYGLFPREQKSEMARKQKGISNQEVKDIANELLAPIGKGEGVDDFRIPLETEEVGGKKIGIQYEKKLRNFVEVFNELLDRGDIIPIPTLRLEGKAIGPESRLKLEDVTINTSPSSLKFVTRDKCGSLYNPQFKIIDDYDREEPGTYSYMDVVFAKMIKSITEAGSKTIPPKIEKGERSFRSISLIKGRSRALMGEYFGKDIVQDIITASKMFKPTFKGEHYMKLKNILTAAHVLFNTTSLYNKGITENKENYRKLQEALVYNSLKHELFILASDLSKRVKFNPFAFINIVCRDWYPYFNKMIREIQNKFEVSDNWRRDIIRAGEFLEREIDDYWGSFYNTMLKVVKENSDGVGATVADVIRGRVSNTLKDCLHIFGIDTKAGSRQFLMTRDKIVITYNKCPINGSYGKEKFRSEEQITTAEDMGIKTKIYSRALFSGSAFKQSHASGKYRNLIDAHNLLVAIAYCTIEDIKDNIGKDEFDPQAHVRDAIKKMRNVLRQNELVNLSGNISNEELSLFIEKFENLYNIADAAINLEETSISRVKHTKPISPKGFINSLFGSGSEKEMKEYFKGALGAVIVKLLRTLKQEYSAESRPLILGSKKDETKGFEHTNWSVQSIGEEKKKAIKIGIIDQNNEVYIFLDDIDPLSAFELPLSSMPVDSLPRQLEQWRKIAIEKSAISSNAGYGITSYDTYGLFCAIGTKAQLLPVYKVDREGNIQKFNESNQELLKDIQLVFGDKAIALFPYQENIDKIIKEYEEGAQIHAEIKHSEAAARTEAMLSQSVLQTLYEGDVTYTKIDAAEALSNQAKGHAIRCFIMDDLYFPGYLSKPIFKFRKPSFLVQQYREDIKSAIVEYSKSMVHRAYLQRIFKDCYDLIKNNIDNLLLAVKRGQRKIEEEAKIMGSAIYRAKDMMDVMSHAHHLYLHTNKNKELSNVALEIVRDLISDIGKQGLAKNIINYLKEFQTFTKIGSKEFNLDKSINDYMGSGGNGNADINRIVNFLYDTIRPKINDSAVAETPSTTSNDVLFHIVEKVVESLLSQIIKDTTPLPEDSGRLIISKESEEPDIILMPAIANRIATDTIEEINIYRSAFSKFLEEHQISKQLGALLPDNEDEEIEISDYLSPSVLMTVLNNQKISRLEALIDKSRKIELNQQDVIIKCKDDVFILGVVKPIEKVDKKEPKADIDVAVIKFFSNIQHKKIIDIGDINNFVEKADENIELLKTIKTDDKKYKSAKDALGIYIGHCDEYMDAIDVNYIKDQIEKTKAVIKTEEEKDEEEKDEEEIKEYRKSLKQRQNSLKVLENYKKAKKKFDNILVESRTFLQLLLEQQGTAPKKWFKITINKANLPTGELSGIFGKKISGAFDIEAIDFNSLLSSNMKLGILGIFYETAIENFNSETQTELEIVIETKLRDAVEYSKKILYAISNNDFYDIDIENLKNVDQYVEEISKNIENFCPIAALIDTTNIDSIYTSIDNIFKQEIINYSAIKNQMDYHKQKEDVDNINIIGAVVSKSTLSLPLEKEILDNVEIERLLDEYDKIQEVRKKEIGGDKEEAVRTLYDRYTIYNDKLSLIWFDNPNYNDKLKHRYEDFMRSLEKRVKNGVRRQEALFNFFSKVESDLNPDEVYEKVSNIYANTAMGVRETYYSGWYYYTNVGLEPRAVIDQMVSFLYNWVLAQINEIVIKEKGRESLELPKEEPSKFMPTKKLKESKDIIKIIENEIRSRRYI